MRNNPPVASQYASRIVDFEWLNGKWLNRGVNNVGIDTALIIVTLLSRGSPSQLTLLVNSICSHIIDANRVFRLAFFLFVTIVAHQSA
jgi:hypothetical protein